MKTKKIFWIWSILGIVIIFGIVIFSLNSKQPRDSTAVGQGSLSWMNIELEDVRTGETFKISDFKGKPVLVESFAVWCPTCTKQQKEIKKLHEEVGNEVISVSLDTDPNEDSSKVLEHLQTNEFDWPYAISPIEMTQLLIDEFGNSIINAPSAPVVLICEDGSFRKLSGSGSRNVDKLKEEIERGC